MVNTIYLLSFVEAPRKFINLRGASTKLNKYNLGLIVRVMFGNFAKIGRAAGASLDSIAVGSCCRFNFPQLPTTDSTNKFLSKPLTNSRLLDFPNSRLPDSRITKSRPLTFRCLWLIRRMLEINCAMFKLNKLSTHQQKATELFVNEGKDTVVNLPTG